MKYLNMRHLNMLRVAEIPQRGSLPLVNLIPMVLSNIHTIILGIAYMSTISNPRDVLLPSLYGHPLNNTLEDESLYITPLYICTLGINWGSRHLKQSDPNITLSNLPWTMVSSYVHTYLTMEFFCPWPFYGTFISMFSKYTTVE